jgi:hypothetical protein
MTNLIDTVAASVEEIEEQMLAEFSRIRNTVSEHRFSSMDTGIRNALLEVLDSLRHDLEHSGDVTNLQLLSVRHENLFNRMVIVRQLLNARIPTAFLHDAHDDIETARQRLDNRASAIRPNAPIRITEDKPSETKGGFMQSLKGMFGGGGKARETAIKSNRYRVTDQEPDKLKDVEVYLNNGMYTPAQELALLAGMINEANPQDAPQEARRQSNAAKAAKAANAAKAKALPTGKAIFESKDLSSTVAPTLKVKPVTPRPQSIAQSPDAIRNKLNAQQTAAAASKANFSSRDIEPAAHRDKPAPPSPFIKAPQPTTGRAIFASRDIESVAPLRPPERHDFKPQPAPYKPTGKAVFESKDVGQKPTDRR